MASSSDLNMIRTIPGDHARAILLFLCKDSRICSKAAAYARELERMQSRKRKAESAIAICVRCGETFDPEDDDPPRSCRYHDGELEVDYDRDVWADHEENCHGLIDTEEMREEHPDGFVYTCCDKLGVSEGCKRGRHEEYAAKWTRIDCQSECHESEEEAETEESVDDESDQDGSSDD